MGNDLTDWSPTPGGRLTHGSAVETGRDQPTHFGGDPKLVAQQQADYRNAVDRVVPRAVIAEWRDDPAGEDFRLRTALDAIDPIRSIEAATRQEIGRRYDYLSPSVQAAVWRELGMGAGGSVRILDDRVLDAAWATPEGAMLRGVWGLGRIADRKMSEAMERIRRIRDELSSWEDEEFVTFVNGLSPHGLACCMAALV